MIDAFWTPWPDDILWPFKNCLMSSMIMQYFMTIWHTSWHIWSCTFWCHDILVDIMTYHIFLCWDIICYVNILLCYTLWHISWHYQVISILFDVISHWAKTPGAPCSPVIISCIACFVWYALNLLTFCIRYFPKSMAKDEVIQENE